MARRRLAVLLLFFPLTPYGAEFAMKITTSKPTYSLDEPIVAEIVYTNPAAAPVRRENPATSLDVLMHMVDGRDHQDLNYSMGTLGVTRFDPGTDSFALVQAPPDMIEIAPAGTLRFTSDVNDRLFLHPGTFDLFLTDGGRESNHLAITVVFDQRSVDALFATASDPRAGYGRREWALDWLRTIQPEYRLDLPLDEDPPEVRARKEAANQAMSARFAQWWQQVRGTIDLSGGVR